VGDDLDRALDQLDDHEQQAEREERGAAGHLRGCAGDRSKKPTRPDTSLGIKNRRGLL